MFPKKVGKILNTCTLQWKYSQLVSDKYLSSALDVRSD